MQNICTLRQNKFDGYMVKYAMMRKCKILWKNLGCCGRVKYAKMQEQKSEMVMGKICQNAQVQNNCLLRKKL